MPLFAVIGLDHLPDASRQRQAAQDAHRAYVVGNDRDLALVGPLLGDGGSPCGSLYLFEAEDEETIRTWLAREPYAQGSVYETLVVRRFELGKNRLPVQDWPNAGVASAGTDEPPCPKDVVDKEHSYRIAREYLAAVTAGELPDALLTPDMTGWITTGGTMDKAAYQKLIRLLSAMCATPITFTIQTLTADEDRVVVEATSVSTLINGEEYRNTYIFVLRLRDGRIASIAEHYNALVVEEKLMPLMAEASARIA